MSVFTQSYLYANRKEIDITLDIKEGKVPEDIFGVAYITSMCGSLNSGGLPIPEKHAGEKERNPEYGTPIMAGDGMIFKIDFNTSGKVRLKTSVTKPPCYYADLATSRSNANPIEDKFKHYGFKTAGLARASVQLGFRNELNTAIIPFQFADDQFPRLVITHDTGRAWEFNPESLELITPIGANHEWVKATSSIAKFPFNPVQTSAHPSFDPLKKEYYTVNYTQKKSFNYAIVFLILLLEHRDEVKQRFEEFGSFFQKYEGSLKEEKIKTGLTKGLKLFFDQLHKHEDFRSKTKAALQKHRIDPQILDNDNTADENVVYLLQWKGEQEPLKRWKVLDEQGENLVIEECMHQTALTEDYILLADSSFKFAPDLLFTNPFPDAPLIDRMLRRLLNERAPLEMALYLIRREDLKKGVESVTAKKVSLAADCIHFTADYKNPDGIITLYALNNNSVCVAEWIRPYDHLKIEDKPVYPELIGLPTIAALDLNSISKYHIDSNARILHEWKCMEKGENKNAMITNGHTWEIALMTYRDMISPDKTVDQIQNLYAFSAGLSSQRLTSFMYDMYKDVPGRNVPLEEVMRLTEAGVPACLFRVDTVDMKIKDSYVLAFNTEIRSLQFVPRKQETKDTESFMNGYILCIMMVGKDETPNAPVTMNYNRELWLFDAAQLSSGPICKLVHPELSYSFPLHSAWIPEAVGQESDYHIDIRKDFEDAASFLPGVQENLKDFFEKYVYHNFEKTGSRIRKQEYVPR